MSRGIFYLPFKKRIVLFSFSSSTFDRQYTIFCFCDSIPTDYCLRCIQNDCHWQGWEIPYFFFQRPKLLLRLHFQLWINIQTSSSHQVIFRLSCFAVLLVLSDWCKLSSFNYNGMCQSCDFIDEFIQFVVFNEVKIISSKIRMMNYLHYNATLPWSWC